MHPEQIKAAMRMKGVTPSALADEMGLACSTVSQVISGRTTSSRVAQRIAEVTGIPVRTLFPAPARPVLRRVKKVAEAA
jgi:lambda repressor-like predicted transcriptional regulator